MKSRCQATTIVGSRCKRKAGARSKFCSSHAGRQYYGGLFDWFKGKKKQKRVATRPVAPVTTRGAPVFKKIPAIPGMCVAYVPADDWDRCFKRRCGRPPARAGMTYPLCEEHLPLSASLNTYLTALSSCRGIRVFEDFARTYEYVMDKARREYRGKRPMRF